MVEMVESGRRLHWLTGSTMSAVMTNMANATLRAYWREAGGDPTRSMQVESIFAEIERRYCLQLPEDFKAYLLQSAPKMDFWDHEDVIWWSPERIKNIPEEYQHPISDESIAALADKCLFFADYMIWCWAWAICCDAGPNHGRIAVIGGSPDRWIADSFTEFVENYVKDPVFVVK